MAVTFDSSVLLGWYQSRAGVSGSTTASTTGSATTAAAAKKYAPTPPWDTSAKVPRESDLVRQVLGGRPFINENAAQLDLPGASADYRKLFSLYQGVNALYGLADQANAKNATAFDKTRYAAAFAKGLTETTNYINSLKLAQLRLTAGDVTTTASTATGEPVPPSTYVTKVLHTGGPDDPVDAFQGAVAFNVHIQRASTTFDIPVDLSDMGSTPRTMANVVNYLNDKLQAAGVLTRFATVRTVGEPRVIKVGNSSVTLPPLADNWSLKIKGDSTEQLTFQPSTTNTAVYLAQTAGDPDPDKNAATNDSAATHQFLKFQTDGTPPPAQAGETNYVAGRLFAKPLGANVAAVRATQAAADGSVYVLADINATTAGQPINGAQDVALQKYDSAGNLVYSRTLGAASTASGLGLAVAADGKVAVVGSVAGTLDPGESVIDATKTDSFVTLYDNQGQEIWTQRRAARAEDQANAVAFGADGTVFVTGQAASAIPGSAGALGKLDTYLEAFGTSAQGAAVTKFVTQFGTAGDDKPAGLVVDGSSVVVASVENGEAVLRRFDVSGAAPVQTAVRGLGDLQGGSLAGLALDGGRLIVGGSTRNASLAAGTVTSAASGGVDAFAASLSADLAAGGADAVAYYGGSGDDKATGMAVSGGKVWLTGQAGTDLPGEAAVGKKDGFLVSLDVANGTVDYSRRFTSTDGFATPTAITVASTGASVLDQLGLPQGLINPPTSEELTANSSVRAGDEFYVRTREGDSLRAVTIEAHDTLKTLATKIQRASGFQVSTSIVTIDGERQLQIKPLSARSTVELVAGRPGRDALGALDLPAGVVRNTTTVKGKVVSADGGGTVYGLKLSNDLNLSTTDGIKAAMSQLSAAMSTIRNAYRDLKTAATPATPASKAVTGKAPAYLTAQVANYQAALDRLTAGQSG